MLKTIRLSVISASRVDDNKVVGDRSAISKGAIGQSDTLTKLAKSKSRTKSGHLGNSNNSEEPKFLTSKVKKTFNYLRQVFTETPILWHFNSEYHIWIEINTLSYAIKRVLS